jgi:hypothetical protein
MDPFVTLLEVHKLMYLSQEAGEKLNLQYAKGPYGPYAENLRHVLHAIEGHFVTGYGDGGDDPTKTLTLLPGAVDAASREIATRADTQSRFERVVELVDGFETPHGMELLATVHWLIQHEGAASREEVITGVHAWSARKREAFSATQIGIAWERLRGKGWLARA